MIRGKWIFAALVEDMVGSHVSGGQWVGSAFLVSWDTAGERSGWCSAALAGIPRGCFRMRWLRGSGLDHPGSVRRRCWGTLGGRGGHAAHLASIVVDDKASTPAVEMFMVAHGHLQLLQQRLVGAPARGVHGGAHVVQDAHDAWGALWAWGGSSKESFIRVGVEGGASKYKSKRGWGPRVCVWGTAVEALWGTGWGEGPHKRSVPLSLPMLGCLVGDLSALSPLFLNGLPGGLFVE